MDKVGTGGRLFLADCRGNRERGDGGSNAREPEIITKIEVQSVERASVRGRWRRRLRELRFPGMAKPRNSRLQLSHSRL